MRGLVWLVQDVRAASSRSCATIDGGPLAARRWERGAVGGGWGGALRMRLRDGSGVLGLGACAGRAGQRRLGLGTGAGGAMRGARSE